MKIIIISMHIYYINAFLYNKNIYQRDFKVNMGFMDGINKAFENEVFDEDPKKLIKNIEIEIYDNKINAIKGQKLIDLIRLSKAPIKFNCKKGNCGSCLSIVNGKKMRVCQMVVNKPIKIKPL